MNSQEEYNNSKNETDLLMTYFGETLSRQTGKETTFKEGPTFADFDYKVFIGDKFIYYIEVKIRRNTSTKYQDIKVPLRKHTFAEHTLKRYGYKTFLLQGFSDNRAFMLDLTLEPDKEASQVARYDRGSDDDLYAFYNLNKVRWIK